MIESVSFWDLRICICCSYVHLYLFFPVPQANVAVTYHPIHICTINILQHRSLELHRFFICNSKGQQLHSLKLHRFFCPYYNFEADKFKHVFFHTQNRLVSQNQLSCGIIVHSRPTSSLEFQLSPFTFVILQDFFYRIKKFRLQLQQQQKEYKTQQA